MLFEKLSFLLVYLYTVNDACAYTSAEGDASVERRAYVVLTLTEFGHCPRGSLLVNTRGESCANAALCLNSSAVLQLPLDYHCRIFHCSK